MNKGWKSSVAIASLALATAFTPLRARPAGKTVWDGVYTEAQAKRGAQVYAKVCVTCHGENLQGDAQATGLTGPSFVADFNGATLAEIFDRTRTTMPDDNPGTLSRQQVADVLAYVLNFNKFPAGDVELPTQAEPLTLIKFLAIKPSGQAPRP